MATLMLGRTGSRRRRRFLFVPFLLAGLAAFFMIGGAQASSPETSGFFQRDPRSRERN